MYATVSELKDLFNTLLFTTGIKLIFFSPKIEKSQRRFKQYIIEKHGKKFHSFILHNMFDNQFKCDKF